MPLPRLHLVELEDLSWFPGTIRDLCTDDLHSIERRLDLHRPAVPLVAEALRESGARTIVDLCSGGAGPVPALLDDLAAQEGLEVDATLTDLFPNVEAFERARQRAGARLGFRAAPVDARDLPGDLSGLRTFFNSLRHFRPPDARCILRSAVEQGQPIGVFEIPERTVPMLVAILSAPFMVMLATPFIRPFRWRRLRWTHLVPPVPLTCLRDGIVSQLRAHSPEELAVVARSAGGDTHRRRRGKVRVPALPARMTYLVGTPRPAAEGDGGARTSDGAGR